MVEIISDDEHLLKHPAVKIPITDAGGYFTATEVESALQEIGASPSSIDHNDLSGLQGGAVDEYYHISSAEYSEITTFFNNTDITAAQAETLSDGSNADSLHVHTMSSGITDWDTVNTVTTDIDFSASSEEDVTISIGEAIKDVVRGRLYIDADPGAAFSQWLTLTFYNKTGKTGDDAFYRVDGKMVYTELEVATSGSDANITPDDHTDFSPSDLIVILDTSNDWQRLDTIADTMVAEDNPAAHAIDVGISRVIELSGFPVWSNESGTDIYCRVSFGSAQTVSMKLELMLRK